MAKQKWIVRQRKVDFDGFAKELGVSPFLVRLLCNKGMMTTEEMAYYLNGRLEDMHDPYGLLDAERAMRILLDKVIQRKHIRVIGDYDVDGVTATYILKRGISVLGGTVSSDIPERIMDGYGLNRRLIETAASDGVDTIITCDNGIAAKDEIALAKEHGMTVLVTDHHDVPYAEKGDGRLEILPDADAVVDPKRSGDTYPYKEICGAVVAYKCMQILFDLAKAQGLLDREAADAVLHEMIEFAAFGTVCDVMPLMDENRILVREGLAAICASQNLGIRTLIETNKLDGGKITAYHIGFILGPCLNATGRLDSAKKALELFETVDARRAAVLAEELVALNEERKKITEDGVAEACRQCDGELKDDKVLVVYLPDCHESVAGIIAGKVREKYHKPCLIVTRSADGLKGSGRSIEVYHMRDGLQRVADLLDKFGGHRGAAGFSLQEENLPLLRERLNETSGLTEEDLVQEIVIDINLPLAYATMEFAKELDKMHPFGMMNEKPLFARKDISVNNVRVVGSTGRVAKCYLKTPQEYGVDGVFFGDAQQFKEDVEKAEHGLLLAYYPDINEYNGHKSLQIVIKHYEAIS